MCANFSHCLNQLEQIDDLAVAISRQHARATTSARDIFCFSRSNNIRNYSVALLTRDNRLQLREWNKIIQQSIEAGLIEKWSCARCNKPKMESGAVYNPLECDRFYGGILLCLISMFIATTILILERIIHQKLREENVHRFWKTADWIIDGRRHMLKSFRAKDQKRKLPWH